jgi:hypothetical protein
LIFPTMPASKHAPLPREGAVFALVMACRIGVADRGNKCRYECRCQHRRLLSDGVKR